MQNRPIVVDLFAGAGGLSLGFEAAGFDIALALEIDPIHAAVHKYNFPYTNILCNDILSTPYSNFDYYLKDYPQVDVVVGGPPCQGFSNIGKQQINDPRNKLVFEYLKVIDYLNPKYFVFENVPGLNSGKNQIFLYELLDSFRSIGYNLVEPIKVLSASEYHVAQKRKRLIIIGSRNDLPPARYPEPTNDSSPGLFAKPYANSYDVIQDLAEQDIFIGKDGELDPDEFLYHESSSIYQYRNQEIYGFNHFRIHNSEKVYNHQGSRHSELSIERFSKTLPGEVEGISRFFRLHPDLPCNTLRAGTPSSRGAFTAPRPIHYEYPRCITVREAARLHSFPDWFRFHRTIWHGFRQIGNSVAPLFAKQIATELLHILGFEEEYLSRKILKINNEELLSFNMSQAAEYFKVPNDSVPKRKRKVVENEKQL